jgi:hypothetical protein
MMMSHLHRLDCAAVCPGSDLVLRGVDLIHHARPVVHPVMVPDRLTQGTAHRQNRYVSGGVIVRSVRAPRWAVDGVLMRRVGCRGRRPVGECGAR